MIDSLFIGPSAPHGVQTFCSAIGWRIPLKSNGKIISFDIQLRLGVDDIITLSTGSDRTFIAVEDDYQKIGTMIQVDNNDKVIATGCVCIRIDKDDVSL